MSGCSPKSAVVAVAQSGPDGLDLDWLEDELANRVIDLVVLPELANGPYFPLEPRTAESRRAETLDGPFVTRIRAITRKYEMYILAGLHLADEGSSWNAALLLGPNGEIVTGHDTEGRSRTSYRKMHLCNITTETADFRESEYFGVGDRHVVWDTPFGRVGCLICYDRHFPEAWRTLRYTGVDIVAVPVASPTLSSPWFVAEMQAMALQQEVYVAVANRKGTERLPLSGTQTQYVGLSCVVAPDGSVTARVSPHEERQIAASKVDPALLSRVRAGNRFFEEMREDVYLHERRMLSRESNEGS